MMPHSPEATSGGGEPPSGNPIVVTGAAGFIGARFVESCAERGLPVISVDRRDYFTERTEHLGIEFGTVIDRDDFLEWIADHDADIAAIVHLGACTDTTNLDEPYLTRVNLEYSQAIWNHACARGVPLVYASSGATYGDGTLGYDDNEEQIPDLEPLNPYGDSKQRFDLVRSDIDRVEARRGISVTKYPEDDLAVIESDRPITTFGAATQGQ